MIVIGKGLYLWDAALYIMRETPNPTGTLASCPASNPKGKTDVDVTIKETPSVS